MRKQAQSLSNVTQLISVRSGFKHQKRAINLITTLQVNIYREFGTVDEGNILVAAKLLKQ